MSCPICAKPVDPAYRPFCSRRCADVDLARWFNESYRIAEPATGEEESADLPPDAVPERPPERPQ